MERNPHEFDHGTQLSPDEWKASEEQIAKPEIQSFIHADAKAAIIQGIQRAIPGLK